MVNDYIKEDICIWFWLWVVVCFKKNVINIRIVKKNLFVVVCLFDIIVYLFFLEK